MTEHVKSIKIVVEMHDGPPLEITLAKPGELDLHFNKEVAAIYEARDLTKFVPTGSGSFEMNYRWVDGETRKTYLGELRKHGESNVRILDPHRARVEPPRPAEPSWSDPEDLCAPV